MNSAKLWVRTHQVPERHECVQTRCIGAYLSLGRRSSSWPQAQPPATGRLQAAEVSSIFSERRTILLSEWNVSSSLHGVGTGNGHHESAALRRDQEKKDGENARHNSG